MKKILLILPVLVLSLVFDSFAQAEKEKTLTDFKGVVLNKVDEAELLKGSTNKVVITYSGVKEKFIVADIIEGSLTIGYKGDKKPDGASLKAKIYTSDAISEIEIVESVKMSVKDVPAAKSLNLKVAKRSTLDMNAKAADKVKISIGGSSKATLAVDANAVDAKVGGKATLNITGTTSSLNANAGGSGKLLAYGLNAKTVTAGVHSSGKVETTVSDALTANAVSEGKLYYKGNPGSTTFNGTSSGKIEKAD